MRRARCQLAKRNQFFRLHHLRLQSLQIFQRRFRMSQQPRAVRICQMGAQKNHQGQWQRGQQSYRQPEVTHRRCVAL